MKIYLAGERFIFSREQQQQTDYILALQRVIKRRLFSFYYHGSSHGSVEPVGKDGMTSDVRYTAQAGVEMFLDSGAYTAFTRKVNLSVDEYAAGIHKTQNIWSTISNLDDTSKNEQKSYDNQKALESLGCKVQPVFHAREETKWLVKYLDEGYNYIFIGGLVPETTQWLLVWLDDIWYNYLINHDGTPRVKVHGFGLTDQKLMFRYPWYSIDSTSWLMTGIFGACIFKTENGFRKIIFSKSSPLKRDIDSWHYQTLPKIHQECVDKWLEPFNVTAEQCAASYKYRDIINAATFQNMETLGTARFIRQQETLF